MVIQTSVVPPPNSKFWVLPVALVALAFVLYHYYLANLWVNNPNLADFIFGATAVVVLGLIALRSYDARSRESKPKVEGS